MLRHMEALEGPGKRQGPSQVINPTKGAPRITTTSWKTSHRTFVQSEVQNRSLRLEPHEPSHQFSSRAQPCAAVPHFSTSRAQVVETSSARTWRSAPSSVPPSQQHRACLATRTDVPCSRQSTHRQWFSHALTVQRSTDLSNTFSCEQTQRCIQAKMADLIDHEYLLQASGMVHVSNKYTIYI